MLVCVCVCVCVGGGGGGGGEGGISMFPDCNYNNQFINLLPGWF